MINAEKQLETNYNTNIKGKDIHIILTYKNEVEPETVKKDIKAYLKKVQNSSYGKFKYCYTVNPIMDKYPAIHILLRPDIRLNESDLLSLWGKGMAKSAVITGADKRAMDYYLTKWGGKTYQSRGLA
ncbi:MAG: hypothetical protein WCD89_10590 [Anaerocolumna sp.]